MLAPLEMDGPVRTTISVLTYLDARLPRRAVARGETAARKAATWRGVPVNKVFASTKQSGFPDGSAA